MTHSHRHRFGEGALRSGYVKCLDCGTHKSIDWAKPVELYGPDYWSHDAGHSTLAEQVHNVDVHAENGLTKNQFIVSLIDGTRRSSCLEVGCAPGILLKRLLDCGFSEAVGIEVDRRIEGEIRTIGSFTGEIVFGVFPQCTSQMSGNRFSHVVCMDVFEHSEEPNEFMRECRRLLKPGGQLLVMSPILVPGVSMLERMFNPKEHIFIHSEQHMRSMASDAGLTTDRLLVRWAEGHECMIFYKQ